LNFERCVAAFERAFGAFEPLEPKVIDRSSAVTRSVVHESAREITLNRAKRIEPKVIDRSSAVTRSVVHESAREIALNRAKRT
jgi:hypothetical protein